MAHVEHDLAAIRQEIAALRIALQTTSQEQARYELHTRLNACIRESLRLINQRTTASSGDTARERSVGEGTST
jgi:hypothetical protein